MVFPHLTPALTPYWHPANIWRQFCGAIFVLRSHLPRIPASYLRTQLELGHGRPSDMQGSGMVRDLREAASLPTAEGAALATKLAEFSAAATRTEQLALIDGLVQAWAATTPMDSRTGADLHLNTFGGWVLVTDPDGRRHWVAQTSEISSDSSLYQHTLETLKVVEAFNGSRFSGSYFYTEQITCLDGR